MDGAGYYGNRMGSRPESYIENNGIPLAQQNSGRRFGPRVRSDPILYNNNTPGGVYPLHGQQHSHDTVASAAVSTDPWGNSNSTDPSSENSSIDKVPQGPKSDIVETYGFNGFGGAPQFQGPILEEHGSDSPAYGQPGYGHSHPGTHGGLPFQGNGATPPPPPPHRMQSGPRTPIKLGGSGASIDSSSSTRNSEKRKSWLKRRFSKG